MRKVKKKNVLTKLTDTLESNKTTNKNKNNRNRNRSRNNRSTKNNDEKINIKNKSTSKNIKNKSNTEKNKKKKNGRSLWKKILTVILIMGIICILLVTTFLGYIVITSPEFDESAFNVQDQTVIYDVNGEIITTLGTEKRESITYDELPQVLIDAIIATEDSRFFQHNGVDLLRFVKATVLQLIGRDDAGGASTITMQAVKNNLTKKDAIEKSQVQKIIRKFQDVYLAVFKVEKEYSKEEILEFYVNDNYLGGSAYGVEEASKYYFDKSASELTLPEASLLAGLFQLPGANNPYKNPEGASARRDLVLEYMQMHGYITKEEATLAKKITVESLLVGISEEDSYQGYIDTVVAEVQELTGDNPYTVPMKIYTTMEKSIQDGINKVLSGEAYKWKDEQVQSGIAVVNVETGAIAAIGAGRNKTGVNQWNFATQTYRQPGSTAKPIFAYGPGIEYKNYSSYTLFTDEEWTYTNGPSVNNWDGAFHGLVTTRYALQYSRNIPALKAFQQIGPKNIQKFAYSLGLDVALNQNSENYRIIKEETGLDNTINEAYSIGGTAEGFTPLQMAAAYSAFASGGYYAEPYTVTKIEYRETGDVKEYKSTKTRVMKDSTAYIINNILESAVQVGFSGGAKVYGSHVAAKTGTTNYDDATMKKHKLPSNAVNDLWTVAYTSKYSVAVWYGYEETTSTTYNTSTGGYKDSLVTAVMKYIPKDTTGWKAPSSVVAVQVEKGTWPAKLPSEHTPTDLITTEYFVKGTQPTETSERFEELNDITNVKIDKKDNTATITWEYVPPKVLTETYLKQYFSQNVFGKSSNKFLEERLKYNSSTLGSIGYGIYKEETDGTLTLINYTTDTTYTYTGYGNTTLVIKAEHQKFKSNASSGTKIELNLEEIQTEKLIATLNGRTSINTNVKTYQEEGIKNIYYGTLDVTNTATIKYQLTDNNKLETYTTAKELENAINSKTAGTYTITYIISYLDKEITKPRNVTLR